MKIRIFYALMSDDDSVIEIEKDYVDFTCEQKMGYDYCSEQRAYQAVLDKAVPRYRVGDKVFAPVIQRWSEI